MKYILALFTVILMNSCQSDDDGGITDYTELNETEILNFIDDNN